MKVDRVVWINKSQWKKPGPIVYMGLLNALSCSLLGIPTDYFVAAGEPSQTDDDLRNFYGVEPSEFLAVHRIVKSKKTHFRMRREVYVAALEHLQKELMSGTKVLVVTREVGVLPYLLKMAKRFSNLRVFHEVHDYYWQLSHLPKIALSDFRRCWAERRYIPRLHGLVCLTEPQRALYAQHNLKVPMVTCSLGTLPDFRPVAPSEQVELAQSKELTRLCRERKEKRRIAYIGHLHEYKGLSLLMKLARELDGREVEICCYGGSHNQTNSLNERLEKEGLSHVIQVHPFVSPKELHKILAREISIGLVPLRNTFYSRYLTCPVKALDFLSHGIPMVASDLPSIRQVADSAARYCSSDCVEEFVGSILKLIDDGHEYEAATVEAIRRSDVLTWRNRAENIVKLAGKQY